MRIFSKEDLTAVLKNFDGNIEGYLYNYLQALLNLEVSAIKEQASKEDLEILKNLDIYKRIVFYFW